MGRGDRARRHAAGRRPARRRGRSSSSRSTASGGRSLRDATSKSYLAVYADFWHTDAVFPVEMLLRTLVYGCLAIGGFLTLAAPSSSSSSWRSCCGVDPPLRADSGRSLRLRACRACVARALALPRATVWSSTSSPARSFAAGFRGCNGGRRPRRPFPSASGLAAAGAATALIALTRLRCTRCSPVAIFPFALPGPAGRRVPPDGGLRRARVGVARRAYATNLVAVRRPRRRAGQASLLFFWFFVVDHGPLENGPASREARRGGQGGKPLRTSRYR